MIIIWVFADTNNQQDSGWTMKIPNRSWMDNSPHCVAPVTGSPYQSLPPPLLEMNRCCFFFFFFFFFFFLFLFHPSYHILLSSRLIITIFIIPSLAVTAVRFFFFSHSYLSSVRIQTTTILLVSITPYAILSRRIPEPNPCASCSILQLSTASRKLHPSYRSVFAFLLPPKLSDTRLDGLFCLIPLSSDNY